LELLEAIKSRRSIRRFKPIPVPDNLINSLIDAARYAPSADNIQPWEIIIVKDKHTKEQLAKTHPWSYFVKDVPVCIVVLGNEKISPSYFAVDAMCNGKSFASLSRSWFGCMLGGRLLST